MGLTSAELSTRHLPETGRDDHINEYFEKIALRFEIDRARSGRIAMEARSIALPGVSVTRGMLSRMQASRSTAMRTDGNDDIVISFVEHGMGLIDPGKVEVEVQPGQAAFTALDRPIKIVTPQPRNDFLTLHIARRALMPLVSSIDDRITKMPSLSRPGLQLLRRYALGLFEETAPGAEMAGLAARHLVELAAQAIGPTADGAHAASAGGVRAARLASAKAIVLATLENPRLSAATVAVRLGVSRRYLDMLFEGEGVSFSEFLMEQRLAKAFRALTDERRGDHRILDIAYEVGFGDIGTFNRAFRKRFGQTPTETRRSSVMSMP